jgi:hypothetical protein
MNKYELMSSMWALPITFLTSLIMVICLIICGGAFLVMGIWQIGILGLLGFLSSLILLGWLIKD